MAVKISSLSRGNVHSLGTSGAQRTDPGSNTEASARSRSPGGDTLSLTSTAGELQQLEGRIKQMPVVDAQLVDEVQRKLSTGSFRVDPESSASKLLDMERSLS